MYTISHDEFENIINKAVSSLPAIYVERLDNVAFIIEDQPSPMQRQQLRLQNNQTLFGLYEGLPLSKRQGRTKLIPDKITLFKLPLEQSSNTLAELRDHISRTIWHEVAHYYGLDHGRIEELEAGEHQ